MSGQNAIPNGLDQEVTYISGFNSDGTLGATTDVTLINPTPYFVASETYSSTSSPMTA